VSANIDNEGNVSQLDAKPEPDETITEDAVKDPKRLAEFLLRLFRDVSTLKRKWVPSRLDFQDLVVSGTGVSPVNATFTHNFAGRVDWWCVSLSQFGSVTEPIIQEAVDSVTGAPLSDENNLVLSFYFSARVTIRVEPAG
jgi:hypothetical protein